MRPLTLLAIPSLMLGGCVLTPPPPASPTASGDATSPAATRVPPGVGAERAIDHADLGADYVLPAAAIEHEGETFLWVVAFGEELEEPEIRRLSATADGPWRADPAPVVIDEAGLELDGPGPIPSSVLVEPGGTWTMYGGGRQPGDVPVVWRATAPGPDGPWTMHPEPILGPSTDGWDSRIVDHPSVVRSADGGYLMTYGGASESQPNRNRIGAATSTDGVEWVRVEARLPDADDDAALGPSACGIDARTMFEPELISIDAGYRLYFGAIRTGTDVMVIGVADSADGLAWECAIDGPLIEPGDILPSSALHSYLVVRGGEERLLVEVLNAEPPSSDLWAVPAG